MGFFSRRKPKIKVQSTKKDGFSGWVKCSGCEELIHIKELESSLHCCPKCNYHYRLSLVQRIQLLTDEDSFVELFSEIIPIDSLGFVDTKSYRDRLKEAQEKTKKTDSIATGYASLEGRQVALAVLDFSFMGGSMGTVLGEKLTRLIEWAQSKKKPLVVVSASGGARMQESILSLMQMAKTSAALAKLHEAKLPYISVLTNPTTGGVTASFATLGDVILAEPDALIAFAGPRIVEQTIGHKLPPDAQKSAFLLEKGMVDCVIPRSELKARIALLLDYLMSAKESLVKKEENEVYTQNGSKSKILEMAKSLERRFSQAT